MSFIASSCEDLTVQPENPPPPSTNYNAIKLYTDDAGGTWEVHDITNNSGQHFISSQRIISLTSDLSNIFVIADERYLLKSTNFGNNWNSIPTNNTYGYKGMSKTGTDGRGFLYGYFTELTTNNGSTWSFSLIQSKNYLDMTFFNEMQGIMIPENPSDTTYVTTNGGVNWILGSLIPTGNYINAIKSVNSFNSTEAIVCGNSGTILRTSDAGASWTEINSPTTENLISIEFSSPIGVIVGEHGTILRSADGGNSWQTVSSGVSNNLKKVYQDPGSLWWAVGDNIILQSGSGLLWGPVRNSATEYYNDILIVKGTGFVVGSRRL